ncbi:transcriptional regulation of mitochondrial recombination-domain-containing protein [Xylariales sp. PMI_506]|nr:transcriptional regulation of mitochondrial recombination-domain-containing protein [Xylariales sp. PMI_506]
MNTNSLRSLTAQLGRLPVSISKTSIRLSSSSKKATKPAPYPLPEGHGEKVWIFSNFVSGLTVYSHSPVIRATQTLNRQIPFNGKKLKPAKIRKDYWRPVAMVQFPEGLGHIGRSVYALLREFRKVHDLAWGDDMFSDKKTGRVLTRHERGEKLNSVQKANAIADLAAVLGGAGKGNHMWIPVVEGLSNETVDTSGQTQTDESGTVNGLLKTTVFWTNELDKKYAKEWPSNVTHSTFAEAVAVPVEEVTVVTEATEATPSTEVRAS